MRGHISEKHIFYIALAYVAFANINKLAFYFHNPNIHEPLPRDDIFNNQTS